MDYLILDYLIVYSILYPLYYFFYPLYGLVYCLYWSIYYLYCLSYYFSIMAFIIGSGLSVSGYLVANYVYFYMINNKPIVGFRFEDDEIEYESKYIEEYQDLIVKELDAIALSALAKCQIMETTPYGDVLLFYNSDQNDFIYYSKKKDIPYKYLETVSRKFVCNNDCKSIYIDYLDEILKAKEIILRPLMESNNSLLDVDLDVDLDSIFANLKTHSQHDIKKIVVPERCNKYIYKGLIEDYYRDKAIMDLKNDAINLQQDANISYAEFKAGFMLSATHSKSD